MNVLIVKRNISLQKAVDISQLTKLKEPCGLDCVRKWFTLNKYTYTHSRAGRGRNQTRPCKKKMSNWLMFHSNRWSPFTRWALKPGVEALIKLWQRDTRQRLAFRELLAHARKKQTLIHPKKISDSHRALFILSWTRELRQKQIKFCKFEGILASSFSDSGTQTRIWKFCQEAIKESLCNYAFALWESTNVNSWCFCLWLKHSITFQNFI